MAKAKDDGTVPYEERPMTEQQRVAHNIAAKAAQVADGSQAPNAARSPSRDVMTGTQGDVMPSGADLMQQAQRQVAERLGTAKPEPRPEVLHGVYDQSIDLKDDGAMPKRMLKNTPFEHRQGDVSVAEYRRYIDDLRSEAAAVAERHRRSGMSDFDKVLDAAQRKAAETGDVADALRAKVLGMRGDG